MNHAAQEHLTKARAYVVRGEEFYRKAAEEIVAALAEDTTLGYAQVGENVGYSKDWVRKLVLWSTSDDEHPPFGGPGQVAAQSKSSAKKMLREAEPEQIAEILSDPVIGRNVAEAQQLVARRSEPTSYDLPTRTDPTFIALVVRINSALIELEAAVKSWENPTAIPPEFSAASFDDIAEKAMRIKDTVNALRSADNDEFQDIVRNFRVVSSGA